MNLKLERRDGLFMRLDNLVLCFNFSLLIYHFRSNIVKRALDNLFVGRSYIRILSKTVSSQLR